MLKKDQRCAYIGDGVSAFKVNVVEIKDCIGGLE